MSIFITGSDTSVGKTLISSWICLHSSWAYWKPIQTGTVSDSCTVASLSDAAVYPEIYALEAPLSPELAARLEGIEINHQLPMSNQKTIVEGAGGIMTPLNSKRFIIDLIEHLELPTIVVARSSLGTINHTILTVRALEQRGIIVLGVVLNCQEQMNLRALETGKSISEHCGIPILAFFPHLSSVNRVALSSIPFPLAMQGCLKNNA